MGVLGTRLEEEDLAADVQARFRDLASELSDAEATEQVISEYRDVLDSSQAADAGIFWLALANVQWQTGRLRDEVRTRALDIIQSGSDLERWPKALREQRQQVLEKLRSQLSSEPPKRKHLAKPFRDRNEWQPGTIITYRRRSGRLVLLRVLGSYGDDGVWTNAGDTCPLIEVLDWQGDATPPVDTIAKLAVRHDLSHNRFSRAVLLRMSDKDKLSSRFETTGLRIERPKSFRETARRVLRRLLLHLAIVTQMEIPNSTCRALYPRSLDEDLRKIYGF